MKALLQVKVEKEDFLTGEVKEEIVDSPALTLYNEKKLAYENAVIDYASRRARANSGTAADLIEWSRSGGILQATRDAGTTDGRPTGTRRRSRPHSRRSLTLPVATWFSGNKISSQASKM